MTPREQFASLEAALKNCVGKFLQIFLMKL